jgi:hypothetical protein
MKYEKSESFSFGKNSIAALEGVRASLLLTNEMSLRKGRQKVDWYNGKPSRALRGKSKVKWSSADVHETRARPTLATNSRIFRDNLSA